MTRMAPLLRWKERGNVSAPSPPTFYYPRGTLRKRRCAVDSDGIRSTVSLGVSVVKRAGRRVLLSVCVGGIMVAFGCADDTSAPVAPSPLSSPVARDAMSSPAPLSPVASMNQNLGGQTPDRNLGVDDEMIGLKATAPTPVEPKKNIEIITTLLQTLAASTSAGLFVEADFEYEFVLSRVTGGSETEMERGLGTPRDANSTSYRVQTELDFGSTYTWRVRAVFDGANGPWSEAARFRTAAVRLAAPRPLSPIDGATIPTLRPTFRVRNGTVEGYEGPVDIRLDVALDVDFMDIVGTEQTPVSPRDETNLQLPSDLIFETRYFWRVRAVLPGHADIRSGWSATQHFSTPSENIAVPGGPVGPVGPFGPGGNPPNMLHVVQAVARQHPDALRNSCQSHGGSWRFMDLVVEALRATSGRWGFNCKRGNCNDVSHDVVDFYRGSGTTINDAQGSTDVAIIDIIAGHCGSSPRPAWIDQTQATAAAGAIGRWKFPR